MLPLSLFALERGLLPPAAFSRLERQRHTALLDLAVGRPMGISPGGVDGGATRPVADPPDAGRFSLAYGGPPVCRLPRSRCTSIITSVDVHPRFPDMLLSASVDGDVAFFDLAPPVRQRHLADDSDGMSLTGTLHARFEAQCNPPESLTCVRWFPHDAGMFATASSRPHSEGVFLWDAARFQIAGSFDLRNGVAALAFSPVAKSHSLIAAAVPEALVAPRPGSRAYATDVTSPAGVRLCDARTGGAIDCLSTGGGPSSGASSVAWSPCHEYILAGGGSTDGRICIWDVRFMRDPLVCQLDAHRTMAPAPPGALFQPDDTPAWTQEHLAEVSARLSASRRGTRAHRPGAPVRGLEFSADGRRLASVGGGGDLLLWDLQPGGQGGLGLQPLGTPRQVAAALRERAWTPSAHAINTLLAFPPAGDETSTGPGGGSGTMPSRSAVLAAVGLGRARAQAPRHPAARAPAAPDARPRRRSRRAAPPPGPRGSDVPAAAVAQPAGRRATPYYAFASAPLAIIDHLEVPLVVAPSGDSIAIFNMLTGEKVRDLVGHFGQVTSVRVRSPRAGGLVELVSAGGGGRILRWVPAVGCRASNFATAEFSSPASLASRPHLALPFTPPEEMAMPAEAALPGGPAPALGPGLAAGASPAQAPHPTKPPASGGMPRPLLPAEASHAEALAAAGLHSVDIDQWSSSDED